MKTGKCYNVSKTMTKIEEFRTGGNHDWKRLLTADCNVCGNILCLLRGWLVYGGDAEIHPVSSVYQPGLSCWAILPYLWLGCSGGNDPCRRRNGAKGDGRRDIPCGNVCLWCTGVLHQLVYGKGIPCTVVGLFPEAHESPWPYLDRQPSSVWSSLRGDCQAHCARHAPVAWTDGRHWR